MPPDFADFETRSLEQANLDENHGNLASRRSITRKR